MSRLALLVVCGLVSLSEAAGVPVSHLQWAKKARFRSAYGLYFRDKKVGWMIDEMKVGTHAGKDVFLSTSETFMETLFDKEKSVKHDRTTKVYTLTGPGAILFAETYKKEDGKELTRRIERDGKGLKITTKQGDRILHRSVPMPKDTLAHHRETEAWLNGPRQKEDNFTSYSVAWDEEDVDSKEVYRYLEKKTIFVDAQPHTAHSVEIDLDGGKMAAVLLADTRIVSATMGGVLTMKMEKEADVKKLDGKLADLLTITSIYVDQRLGLPKNVDTLKLELRGLGEFKIPQSHRQIVTPEKDGVTILELRRDYRAEKAQPLTDKEKKEYLRTSPRLQCDQEQVKNLAKKVVGEEKDVMKAVEKLERWVYENLAKTYSDNADTALEILDRKAGDCTEHSLLFVALARAAGIPAREVGGLAYVPDTKPLFGWHAWAEVHDGEQWVSVDPTWGQVYVDGTHLKMSTGDRDLAWTNVIGTLKMKVIEVKKKG